MEFRLLGPFEARHEGHPVAVANRRQERSLLAILLLETGRLVPTERLIELLWPGREPGSGRGTVHTYIGRLRGTLAPYGVQILTRAEGYLVEPAGHVVDAGEFTRLVHQATEVGDLKQRVGLLDQALALWRGPLLADTELRLRLGGPLEELRLVGIELRAEARLELGQHGRVVGELTAHVQANPTRERLLGTLMTALYRNGGKADALRAFDNSRKALADELGLDPGPELRELHRRILHDDHRLNRPRRAVYEVRVGDESLPWMVGGHPALEFCNTWAGWHMDPPLPGSEWLRTYRTFAVWAGYAGLADDAAVNRLRDLARRQPEAAEEVLAQARSLRTALYECLTDPGNSPAFDTVARSAETAARTMVFGRDRDGRGRWRAALTSGLWLPMHGVAWSAAELLADARRLTVRACPSQRCGWLFLDETGMRRWCSLATCGDPRIHDLPGT